MVTSLEGLHQWSPWVIYYSTSVSGVNRTRQFNVKVTLGLACFPHCKWYIVYDRQVGFFWRTFVVPINRAFE